MYSIVGILKLTLLELITCRCFIETQNSGSVVSNLSVQVWSMWRYVVSNYVAKLFSKFYSILVYLFSCSIKYFVAIFATHVCVCVFFALSLSIYYSDFFKIINMMSCISYLHISISS